MSTLLLMALKGAIKKILAAMFGERLLLWSMIALGKVLVAKTTTQQDDAWLARVEKSLKDSGDL